MVEQLKDNYDVQVEWSPFLLRPDMPPEGMSIPGYIKARGEAYRDRLRERAAAHDLSIVFRDWIPNPRLALEASEYARAQGKHETFHKIVFRKFFGEGADISDWEVLRAAAEESDLDPEAMQEAVEKGNYQEEFEKKVSFAYNIGVTGIPTYVINDRYALVGAQPYEVFQQTLEQLKITPKKN